MDITQTFYDSLASEYDKLFQDWKAAAKEQAAMLDRIFQAQGFDATAHILDCACGIGTQAIGLAALGYTVTASDISHGALKEALQRAEDAHVDIPFVHADFRALSQQFAAPFDIVIAMDNALPHMMTRDDLQRAVASITAQIREKGIFVCSIRDYDTLLTEKPNYSPPYIHAAEKGQRVSFQTWHWQDDCYQLVQYIIDDSETLSVSKFTCQYRATRRKELSELFLANGCSKVVWMFPEETGFYQPIAVVRK